MCSSREEYFARRDAQRAATLPAPIVNDDPGDETAHDPGTPKVIYQGAELTEEEYQDARIATLEGQIMALTERLVHLAVAHATLKAEVSLTWRARLKAWFARRRAYRPRLFMGR
jgi:hypothetical protein